MATSRSGPGWDEVVSLMCHVGPVSDRVAPQDRGGLAAAEVQSAPRTVGIGSASCEEDALQAASETHCPYDSDSGAVAIAHTSRYAETNDVALERRAGADDRAITGGIGKARVV